MWFSVFAVILIISIGLSVASVILQSGNPFRSGNKAYGR